MSFSILTFQGYHTKLHLYKKDLQDNMITGKNNITCTLFVHMCLSEKIPSCIDNLHRGMKYLTYLTHKIRVDTQYLYTRATTYYISVNTQKHNSYTCVLSGQHISKGFTTLYIYCIKV